MTSVVEGAGGGGGGRVKVANLLDVSQGEEAKEDPVLVEVEEDSKIDTSHASTNGEEINTTFATPPSHPPSIPPSPDSAIGATPIDLTPDSEQISLDAGVVAGDRLDEEGYEEDSEGEDYEEGEEEEEDLLSEPEVVVSASMQFPLAQKPPGEVVKDGEEKEGAGEEKVGEAPLTSTPPSQEPGQQVIFQVNSQMTQPLLKDGTPSGCESDIEDNDEDSHASPTPSPTPKQEPQASPSLGRAPLPSDLSLPSTVTRLDTPQGSSVFVVGTAHFSRESQDDVAQTIRTVRPDIVVVELCKARTAILQLDEDTILQESRNLDFRKMQMILNQHGKIQGVLYLLLLSVSAHITKQLGMAPGGEFRTAFAEARRSAPGCLIQLGDRPIQVTLSRALASLSFWHKLKLTWHILTSKEPISKEEVEKCKQRDFIEEMLAEMTGQFPAISEVFVKERDLYLCRSLQAAAQPIPSPLSPTGISPRVVVGVVGIGHVPGIVEHWGKVTDADILPIMRIPPPSTSSRVLKVGFRLTVYATLGYGIFHCLPGSTKHAIRSSTSSFLKSAIQFIQYPWWK